ncbi:superoxide dismutase [soil metagenome]
MLTRRETFRLTAATLLTPTLLSSASAADAVAGFTLPKLPYANDALEPSIDAVTMETHHDKHHKAYVDNLNAALKEYPDWLKKSPAEVITHLKDVPEKIRMAVRNNGGGHWNHTFFWNIMAPAGKGGKLSDDLAKAIDASFGSFDKFKAEFKDAGMKRFGSGWAWLVPGKEKLSIVSSPNQDNPLMDGGPVPLLGVDVWEHAYYLKYKNLRAAYIDAWWNVVNWDAVSAHYAAFKK